MLGILAEAVLPVFRGGRIGFRVRVKPSWSGRVYGTYSLNGRIFLFSILLVASTAALFGRLLALNLAEPGTALEHATLRRCAAHAQAAKDVLLPADVVSLERKTSESYSLAHQLDTMLGLLDGGGRLGLGRMVEIEEVEPAAARHPRLVERLASDVAQLEKRFGALAGELRSRDTQLRFTPSIVPIFQSEFVPTSPFGRRISPFTRLPEMHRGQDIAADMYTRIVATADGIVVRAERDAHRSHMGRYVVIDHGGQAVTYYGHCERLFVEVGDPVVRHQVIAEVGSTGRSTGPHLHYEVRVADEPRDPRHFMVFDPHFQAEEDFRFD